MVSADTSVNWSIKNQPLNLSVPLFTDQLICKKKITHAVAEKESKRLYRHNYYCKKAGPAGRSVQKK